MVTKKTTTTWDTIITPAKGGTETRWLLIVAMCILIVCAIAISARTRDSKETELKSWQINAFEDLNAKEIGVFNSLLTASIEIEQTHDFEDGYWLEVNELEGLYVPPFVKDSAWKKQGQITWEKKILNAGKQHIAMYKGIPSNNDVRGTFLLLMLHDHRKKQGSASKNVPHAPFEIWFHKNTPQKFPETITDQALISSGWNQIIALTGEDEANRMKGKKIP